jgi:hypothetical protein
MLPRGSVVSFQDSGHSPARIANIQQRPSVVLKIGDGIFQQRRTTMNYAKPEVSTIGDATTVIEMITGKPTTNPSEGPVNHRTNPAYDLDE